MFPYFSFWHTFEAAAEKTTTTKQTQIVTILRRMVPLVMKLVFCSEAEVASCSFSSNLEQWNQPSPFYGVPHFSNVYLFHPLSGSSCTFLW